MKIYAPVKNVNGVYASVLFKDSVGETDNPALIHWFKAHGYIVVEDKVDAPKTEEMLTQLVEEHEPDFEAMTPLELRDWMKEHGYGSEIKNIRNKARLLEIIRG
jgi:hypothetical protein